MATFYLINTISFAGGKLMPGTKLDSVVDPSSYNAAVNAGGELVPTSDVTVAAAAAVALQRKLQGANELELEAIMRAAVDKSQGDQKGGLLAASDLATSSGVVQSRTVTVLEADLTAAVNGTAQVVNIGAVLPANAVVVGHEVNIATLFSGGGATAVKLDIGGTTATAIVNQMDIFSGAATGALSPRTGAHAAGKFSAEQLVATFTPDAGHQLVNLTAGSLTITVWFVVL